MGVFAERARVLHALRSRDFRLVWGGQSVSLIGNGALFVALGWRAVALTGKSTSLAFVLLLWSLGMLTTLLIGGALADRYERRRLMIISDVSRGLLVAGLAVVDASGHLTLTRLLLFALALGLGDGFFHPAFGGIVPLVVEQPLLASANALIGISRNISFVIGPAIASALYVGLGSRPSSHSTRGRTRSRRRCCGSPVRVPWSAKESRPGRCGKSSTGSATSQACPGCG